jgi:penicillin-binding protein 1A
VNSYSSSNRSRGGNVRRRVPFYKRKWFVVFVILLLIGGVATLGGIMWVIKPLQEQADAFDLDALQKIERASIVYDRRGEELGRIYVLNRTPVKIEQVPMHFIQALTAEEDARFFQHSGVDQIGIIRAFYLNWQAHKETQGASTITQQLARDAFRLKDLQEAGDKWSRYKRKLVEAFLAERIEKRYTKSEILELYLNRIYFGAGFYGVQAAAQGYFGKDVTKLDIMESATICGIIKSPNNLQPLRYKDRAKKARNHVLDRMLDEGVLSKEDHDAMIEKPVVTTPRETDARLSYVYEEVRQQVVKIVGEEAAQAGGFKVYTTLDSHLQKAAEESVRKRLAVVEQHPGYARQTYAQYHKLLDDWRKKINAKQIAPDTPRPQPDYLQAAVLMMDNHDGGVLAMVGGRDFLDSMYNRAVQARRPAGTAFIPFLYATAFQSPEYFPPLRIEDGPMDNRRVNIGGTTGILGEWGAEQKEEVHYKADISMREALVQSRTAATIRLGERVGLDKVKELVAKAGIASSLRDYSNAFLGTSEVRLDEMCLAYSTFADSGKRPKELVLIHRITDSEGKVIFQVKEEEDTLVPVMDEMAAYQTHSCLVDALRRGTGRPAYEEYGLEDFPAAGKTGTHYDFKDLWFMGYTSSITCGVWCGFDQQKPIYTEAYSNRIALPIWVDAMNAAHKGDYKAEVIPPPQNAQMVEVCRKSGLRATDACYEKVPDPIHGGTRLVRDTYKEALRPNSVFEDYCDVHQGSAGPVALSVLRSSENNLSPNVTGASTEVVGVEPVHMQGATILGPDPYNSIQPVLRAQPVNPDGSPIRHALPVEEESSTPNNPIKLAPPPPLKLD